MNYLLVILFIYHVMQNVCGEGFVAYCPCMGRFGNQADHFLGALGFAKGLNRTLIVPPWVEYRQGESKSIQVPFKNYFKLEKLQEFHDVIAMEEFMTTIAADIWPPEKRVAFCYADRGEGKGCNAKDGNPFGPFWDTFNVDFVGSERYAPLQFDVHHGNMSTKWKERYPASINPVLAFVGAPASFPVQMENKQLHKYLVWTDEIQVKAREFIKNVLPKGGFVGIHLRNGIDWVRACEHIAHSPNLFAAPQCLGYRNEMGVATADMCYPSSKTIIKHLKRVLRASKDVASLFVASDSNYMIQELKEALKGFKLQVKRLDPSDPHLELAILGQANHFVGNCISSFTAFVKRERDVHGFKTTFWAFPTEKKKTLHEEL